MRKIIFTGTGPISLLKAYLLSKSDPDCEIIFYDRKNKIGGAWYAETSPKGYEIECGCHIWSYVPKVYSYIEKELDLKLFKLNPDAVFVGKRIKLPYATKNTVNTYKFILKNLFVFKWSKLSAVKTNPEFNTEIFGKRNKYPIKGSPMLINALYKKMRENPNINFKTNCSIDTICLGNQNKISGSFGEQEFDKIYLTSVSEINNIQLKDKSISIKNKRIDYIHFLIQLDKALLKKIFYWRLISDDVIHRISDVSYQTNCKENLLLIAIKGDAFESKTETELFDHCKVVLTNYKLIDESFKSELVKTHIYPTFYIEEDLRNQINKLENIELIHSTDLMHGIYYLLKQEKII